jgi:hypothetical protein
VAAHSPSCLSCMPSSVSFTGWDARHTAIASFSGTCIDPKTQIVDGKTVCVVSCHPDPLAGLGLTHKCHSSPTATGAGDSLGQPGLGGRHGAFEGLAARQVDGDGGGQGAAGSARARAGDAWTGKEALPRGRKQHVGGVAFEVTAFDQDRSDAQARRARAAIARVGFGAHGPIEQPGRLAKVGREQGRSARQRKNG